MTQFKIVKRERFVASPPRGMSQEWIEYQVRSGRKVVARLGSEADAQKWIDEQTAKAHA